jgi:hypothetical protein
MRSLSHLTLRRPRSGRLEGRGQQSSRSSFETRFALPRVNAPAFNPWVACIGRFGKLSPAFPMDRMSHFAVQQYPAMAPAKGAMVIRPDSLYRCGWYTSLGTGLFPVLQK